MEPEKGREPDATWISEYCKCGFTEIAHHPDPNMPHRHNVVAERICSGFTPHGAYEYDKYYCGCYGWE